jgi:hypothetical protein
MRAVIHNTKDIINKIEPILIYAPNCITTTFIFIIEVGTFISGG